MCQSTVCRRLVAVVLLIAGLLVVPAAPALAAGDDAEAAQGEDSGVVQEVIDWLVELVAEEETGDAGPRIDPTG